jgi:hypothetical protein
MNLRDIASKAVSPVNSEIAITIKQSTGYTTGADGAQTPTYSTVSTTGRIQALSGGDIKRIEGLNIQGVVQKVYLNGNYEGQFRKLGKGGDLLVFGGKTYLVNIVFERWPDWCAVGVTAQLD